MSILSSSVAGIDISKTRLDVCILPQGDAFSVSAEDRDTLSRRLRRKGVGLVVVEPTGGLERQVVAALEKTGIAPAVVNARQIRDFARASGLLAKTDRLDARVLAEYAARMTPQPRERRSEDQQRLCGLVRRRRQLVEMRKGELTRRHQVDVPDLDEGIERSIRFLTGEIKAIERKIKAALDAAFASVNRILRSMPGIGLVTAASLLAELPELGRLSRRKIAALVGVAPFSRDSGAFRGRRTIWGGRAELRHTLHMAVISATRQEGSLRNTYQRLRQAGKPHKVATTAVLRKMIVQLNAMIRDNKHYVTAT